MPAPRPVGAAAVVTLLATVSSPVAAGWIETQHTTTPIPSTAPILTTDAFDVRHLLWQEGDEILHQDQSEGGWGPIETVGVGHDFDHYTCLR